MSETDIKKWMMDTKIEIETLRTMLIQRGKINSIEYESLKKKISEEMNESRLMVK